MPDLLIGTAYSVLFATLNNAMFYWLIIKNKNSQDVKSHAPIKNSLSFVISVIALMLSLYVTDFVLNPEDYWSSLWSYIIICTIGKITILFINKLLNWEYKDTFNYTKDIRVTVFFACFFLAFVSYYVGVPFWTASYITVAIGKFIWLDFSKEKMKEDINDFFGEYSWAKFYGILQVLIMLIGLIVEIELNISEIYFTVGMLLTAIYMIYKTRQIVTGDKEINATEK